MQDQYRNCLIWAHDVDEEDEWKLRSLQSDWVIFGVFIRKKKRQKAENECHDYFKDKYQAATIYFEFMGSTQQQGKW